MRKVLSVVLLLLSVHLFSQVPALQWVRGATLSSASNEGLSVEHDSQGNVYVCGSFYGSIIFGTDTLLAYDASSSDIFLAKFDPSGASIWARSWGGVYNEKPNCMAIDESDNILLAGYFNSPSISFGSYSVSNTSGSFGGSASSAYVVKINASGNELWAKESFNNLGSATVLDVTSDPGDNVIVTGIFTSSFLGFGGASLTNTGLYDVFTVKFDPMGSTLWSRSGNGTSLDWAYGVISDDSGNIYITGGTDGAIFGTDTLESDGYPNIFLVKYNPMGNVLWGRCVGGTGQDFGMGIQLDSTGNVYVSGYGTCNFSFGTDTLISGGGMDVIVLKFDPNGDPVWGFNSTGALADYSYTSCLAIDDSNNLYLTGQFASPTLSFGASTIYNSGSTDIFLASLDDDGNVLYAAGMTGESSDVSNSITCDASGSLYITGRFSSDTLMFGNLGITNLSGAGVMYVAKLQGGMPVSVWPSDTDYNNVVDNRDLLPIGLYYGTIGYSRLAQDNFYTAHTSADWGMAQVNGTDLKHVDCDGDGVVTDNDTLAVNMNYSMVHAFAPSNNEERVLGSDLYFVTASSSYFSGNIVDVEVWAGNSATPVTNLYGIAFDINYDASLVQPATESLTYSASWLGTPGADAITIAKVDAPANTAYGAETRIDQTNASGFGKIADFKFQLKSSIPSNTVMNFSISGYSANDASGTSVLFNVISDSIIINPSSVGITETTNIQFNIYPNPTNGSFNVSTSEINGRIEVYNSIGCLIHKQEIENTYHTIDLKDQANGLYFVKVIGESGVVAMKKLVKE